MPQEELARIVQDLAEAVKRLAETTMEAYEHTRNELEKMDTRITILEAIKGEEDY